jgi:hypothetical protein
MPHRSRSWPAKTIIRSPAPAVDQNHFLMATDATEDEYGHLIGMISSVRRAGTSAFFYKRASALVMLASTISSIGSRSG